MRMFIAILALLVTGAAGTAHAQYTITHQASGDIAVLRAEVTQTIDDTIDFWDCAFTGKDVYKRETYDCKAAIEAKLGARMLRHSYPVAVATDPWDGKYVADEKFLTPLVMITTVTREAALADAGAVGFVTSAGYEYFYWQPGDLNAVETVTLADGTTGIVHRFVVDFQRTGQNGGAPIRSIGFRPFVDFHVFSQNKIYRNWDWNRPPYQNYYLTSGYSPYVKDLFVIDQSSWLLAPQ